MDIFDLIYFLFTVSRDQLNALARTVPKFPRVLAITALPRRILVRHPDKDAQPTPKCRKYNFRCRVYKDGTGILTGFPFPPIQLGGRLGPTNP